MLPQQRLDEGFECTFESPRGLVVPQSVCIRGCSWRCDEAFRLAFGFDVPFAPATIDLPVDLIFTLLRSVANS